MLQDSDKAWLAAPADLGFYLDPETTASAAYEIGRSGTIGDRLSAQFQAWREGVEIAPSLVFDQRTAFAYLTALAAQVDRPVVEASQSLKSQWYRESGIFVQNRVPLFRGGPSQWFSVNIRVIR